MLLNGQQQIFELFKKFDNRLPDFQSDVITVNADLPINENYIINVNGDLGVHGNDGDNVADNVILGVDNVTTDQ